MLIFIYLSFRVNPNKCFGSSRHGRPCCLHCHHRHIFQFSEEIQHLQIGGNDFLVSYDVTALFTNVPLEETIQILAKKPFNGNWFNNTHNLNICEGDLTELLTIATKHQLFQFNGDLYKQIDGVAMGSPLGPLMANTFRDRSLIMGQGVPEEN